jgi:ribosomal protein RSM22 (predicted rRNA methylase)
VLDLGAGLGAMTWGLVRALRAAKGGALVEATWVDSDPDAMGVALEIVRERARGRDSELQVRPLRAGLDEIRDVGAFDVVLAGNLLSELSVGKNDEVRLEEHVHLLRGLLDRHTVESGALVIVEPALRERTRHLHRVRDALARLGVSVFAPCLHGQPCPALVLETDWCHESLPIDLPGWLVPVARAAGLRFERLTFSYLVLRKRGPVLRDAIRTRPSAGRLRVVSDVLATKGKSEVFLCGEFASSAAGGLVDARKRVSRLLRDERADGRSTASRPRRWVDLARGELLVIDPAPDLDAPRIGLGARVEAAGTPGESDGIDRG